MPRYALTIEYNGEDFAGWQIQQNAPSIQQAIATAITKMTGEVTHVQGAGRTDAGVHAWGQVAHFDLSRDWLPHRLAEGLNYHLRPHPIAILAAHPVAGEFHARFSAVMRHYVYRLVIRRAPMVLAAQRAWALDEFPEIAAMQQAADFLIGKHDFSTFRAKICQAKSPIKTLTRLHIEAVMPRDLSPAGDVIEITASAPSFLHTQVRSLVGSLVEVGRGKWSPHDMADALAARDRARCGPVAPPYGLYLARVDYSPGLTAATGWP
ncbi:MAG: tRNA pseudouridine(38-40) synthase TruA [Candidatus Symbiobacter sp.]|nr:tRNA pseudouridine(38-40) synthase TruA [Candidatus Symbiobacter sp.]